LLILCSEEDGLCPLERHEMMRDLISGARLTVTAGAGYLPVLEQPELTNKEIKL
jgi:pimeloyl-ACP methyl ester carboxylesterase